MADKQFILNLGKLVIAAAWADGTLSLDEVNALKDLLFVVPDMTGEDWQALEIYMDSPVSPEERQRLLQTVIGSIRWTEEKELVVKTLTNLVEADGTITPEEKTALEDMKKDIAAAPTGLLAHMSQVIRGAVRKRETIASKRSNREDSLEDFINNRVYFYLSRLQVKGGKPLTIPDHQIRKLCLAAGLMAQVAWVDDHLSRSEQQTMIRLLQEEWALSVEEAELVAEAACMPGTKGLDIVRLTRYFFNATNYRERLSFVKSLFAVANAAQKTSYDEIQSIQFIAKGLKVPHKEFIAAKLTIPREDRKGL